MEKEYTLQEIEEAKASATALVTARKKYTAEQLEAAQDRLEKAMGYAKEAVAALGDLDADGTVPHDMDNEPCVSYWYLWSSFFGMKNLRRKLS